MAQYSEQDLILLNSYLDGRLDAAERAALEARLAQDRALRDELESLRATVGLLKMAERVPAPRSFTLDPAQYSKAVRRSFWDRYGLASMPAWAVATASLAVVVLCIGALIAGGEFGGEATRVASNSAAPQAAPVQNGPAFSAAVPAPTEAATEALAEAVTPASGGPAVAPAPTGAPPSPAILIAQAPTGVPAGKSAPVAPQAAASMATPAGAGAVSSGSAGGAAQQSPPSALTLPPAPPSETQPAQPAEAGSAGAQDSASRAMTSNATPAPYGTIEITEAAPWDNLKSGSWAVLLAGTAVVFALVLGVTFLIRRRQ